MTMDSNSTYDSKVILHGKLAHFRDAIEAEIKAIESGKGGTINISEGKPMSSFENDFRYRFHVEYVDSIIPDTPCQIVTDKKRIKATIISCDETSVVVSCEEELDKSHLAKATLKTGSSQLMRKLIERIEEKSQIENKIGDIAFDSDMFGSAAVIDSYDNSDDSFNSEQRNAINSAVNKGITFIGRYLHNLMRMATLQVSMRRTFGSSNKWRMPRTH